MRWRRRRRREIRCKIFSIHRSLSRYLAIRPHPRLSGKSKSGSKKQCGKNVHRYVGCCFRGCTYRRVRDIIMLLLLEYPTRLGVCRKEYIYVYILVNHSRKQEKKKKRSPSNLAIHLYSSPLQLALQAACLVLGAGGKEDEEKLRGEDVENGNCPCDLRRFA